MSSPESGEGQILKRYRLLSLALLFWAIPLFSGSAAAEVISVETFKIGDWHGNAWQDAGTFSHCTIAADYKSGITLMFTLTPSGYGVSLINPEWDLEIDESYPITMEVDDLWRSLSEATAYVDTYDGIIAFIGFNDAAISALRNGLRLRVLASSDAFTFRLDGTKRAFEALDQCSQRHFREARTPTRTNPFAQQRDRSVDLAATSGDEPKEFRISNPELTLDDYKDLVAAIISEASVEKTSPDYQSVADYVASHEDGWFSLYWEETTETRTSDKVFDDVVSHLGLGCEGQFASGRDTALRYGPVSLQRGFAACGASEPGEDSVYLAITLLDYGDTGSVFVTVPIGEDSAPANEFNVELLSFLKDIVEDVSDE